MNSSKKASKHTLLIYTSVFFTLISIVLIYVILVYSSKPVQTTPTTIETTKSAYDLEFEYRISRIRSAGMNDMADRLISFYETDSQVAYSLSFLALPNVHPDVAELLMQQPWYLDGISDDERIFMYYGLGSGSQGIAGRKSSDPVIMKNIEDGLKNIIVNELYVVDTMELQGGVKYIISITTNSDEKNTGVHEIIKYAKESFPFVENQWGIAYPKAAVVICLIDGYDNASGGEGTISMSMEGYRYHGSWSITTIAHEFSHLMEDSHPNGMNRLNGMSFSEGIATLMECLIAEEFGGVYQFTWDGSVEALYERHLDFAKEQGWWETPLAEANFVAGEGRMYVMEFLFIKDLRDTLGPETFTKLLSDLYDYMVTNYQKIYRPGEIPGGTADEEIWEEYALKNCPDGGVRALVQKLFDERVWGK